MALGQGRAVKKHEEHRKSGDLGIFMLLMVIGVFMVLMILTGVIA